MAKLELLTMKIFIFGVLISMFAAAKADDKLLIRPHPMTVKEGQSFKLVCELHLESMSNLLKNALVWKHNNEKLTFNERVEGEFNETYKVNTTVVITPIVYTSELEILKVSPSNDGNYTCESHKKVANNFQVFNKAVTDIVVLQDIGELVLTVGTTEITAKNSGLRVNIPETGQKFVCRTRGSNPKPIIHFYLDGKDMKNEWEPADISSYVRVTSGAKSGVRSHSSELVAEGKVLIKKSNKVRSLSCTAEMEGSAFKVKTVTANISFAFDPQFTCKNKSAILNDRYVTLECEVEANPPITKHAWRYGDVSVVEPNNETVEYTQSEEVVDGVHRVTLTIDKVLKRHFNTTFFLEVETEDNKVHTHPVRLTEKQWSSASTRHYQEFLFTALLTLTAKILTN
ncbi:uncharacterized protein LOC106872046 isoform X1 [Octopus bimaculoides]|nr:uncharacterized protein LOC106872046 isoform X1 [Octopus bimaculoides]